MKLRFLANPSAGGGRARRLLELAAPAARELGAAVEVSQSGSDLVARARNAVAEGVERLVVVGGDGTVHLAIQALAESACELAVLPAGRGDDLAACLGVPADSAAALELAIGGQAAPIDLGRAGDRWFGVYAGAGFDSAVTDTANRQSRWVPPSLTYVVATLRTLARFRAPRMRVEHDGGVLEGRAMFVTVCNGHRYGGGMKIAPEARLDDGLMDLVWVREGPKLELLRIFPRVFKGTHVDHPWVTILRTRRARLEIEPGMLLGSDGEIVGPIGSEPVEIEIHPAALRAVVGPGASGPSTP